MVSSFPYSTNWFLSSLCLVAKVREADRIAVLRGGLVAEIGTYDDLLERKGVFHDLVEQQLTI